MDVYIIILLLLFYIRQDCAGKDYNVIVGWSIEIQDGESSLYDRLKLLRVNKKRQQVDATSLYSFGLFICSYSCSSCTLFIQYSTCLLFVCINLHPDSYTQLANKRCYYIAKSLINFKHFACLKIVITFCMTNTDLISKILQ